MTSASLQMRELWRRDKLTRWDRSPFCLNPRLPSRLRDQGGSCPQARRTKPGSRSPAWCRQTWGRKPGHRTPPITHEFMSRLRVDPRVIGDVRPPGFGPPSLFDVWERTTCGTFLVEVVPASLAASKRVGSTSHSVERRERGCCVRAAHPVAVQAQRIVLTAAHSSCICSEADVKHGCEGDKQCSSGAPSLRCPTWAFRQCLACC